jgi:hypothetical protein
MKSKIIILVICLLLAALVGCGSDDADLNGTSWKGTDSDGLQYTLIFSATQVTIKSSYPGDPEEVETWPYTVSGNKVSIKMQVYDDDGEGGTITEIYTILLTISGNNLIDGSDEFDVGKFTKI